MKTGDKVQIECQGVSIIGTVVLASSNGKSLMLGFDGILDGHFGGMPVLRDDDGTYRSIMSGTPVKLREAL